MRYCTSESSSFCLCSGNKPVRPAYGGMYMEFSNNLHTNLENRDAAPFAPCQPTNHPTAPDNRNNIQVS